MGILTQQQAATKILITEDKPDFHKSNNSGSLSPIASAIMATNTSPITLEITIIRQVNCLKLHLLD